MHNELSPVFLNNLLTTRATGGETRESKIGFCTARWTTIGLKETKTVGGALTRETRIQKLHKFKLKNKEEELVKS